MSVERLYRRAAVSCWDITSADYYRNSIAIRAYAAAVRTTKAKKAHKSKTVTTVTAIPPIPKEPLPVLQARLCDTCLPWEWCTCTDKGR